MEQAISLRDVGVRFRMHRRGHRGKRVPRLVGRRQRFWGIRRVSLDIAHGEVVGLIGPNGSGKTTLLRLVSGIYVPDEGTALVRGRVSPLLSATAGLEVGLSGWENVELSGVMLGLTRRQAEQMAPAVAEFAGLGEFMDAPVRVYSSGMRARLGFAIAAFSEPDILALDEVISVGDHEFREKSAMKVRELIEARHTALVATHDVSTIVEMCDRLVRLERGRIVDEGEPQAVADRYIADHGGHVPRRTDVFRGVRAGRARRA